MEESDIEYYFTKFDSLLNQGIRIGFHGHNNMNLAFSNAIKMLKFKTNRSIILDSTLLGMGQGAGNLQTELILGYLNNNYNKNYNLEAILDACEIIETFKPNCPWGYSVAYLIAAINKTAYKFSKNLRNRGLKYKEIYRLLKNIPDDMRHRYTAENEKMLYESL